jgi:hypothetical protein
MTDKEQAAIRRAIGAIEAAKNDAMGRFYVQALMSHETALAELRSLLDEPKHLRENVSIESGPVNNLSGPLQGSEQVVS